MFHKTVLISMLMLILGSPNLTAQDTLQITDAYINLKIDTSCNAPLPTHANINAQSMANVGFCVEVFAQFSDPSLVDVVHIKVGRTPGGHQIRNVSIPYSGLNLPSTVGNFRKDASGFSICVAPSARNAMTLYLEIWADDINGNTTPVYSMHVN